MIKVMGLLKKKAGMSMEDFIEYYETRHAKLGESYLSNARIYRRHYLKPVSYPLTGELAESAYDVVTELQFDTEEDYREAMATLGSPEVSKIFSDDEENLFNRPFNQTFVVETHESQMGRR